MQMIKTWGLCLVAILFWQDAIAQAQLQQPGYYRTAYGSLQIVALSDGTVPIQANTLLTPKDPAVLTRQLKKTGLAATVEISINAYLIKDGSRLILVDAGSGDLFGPFGGQLTKSIAAAGFRPEDISDILLTHVHLDHSGGLIHEGKPVFPNAIIHLSQKELDFWKVHEAAMTGEAKGITANRPAYLALSSYLKEKKVRPFSGSSQILPGITAMDKPGHTVYITGEGRQKMVFLGDLVHIEKVQFYDPSIPDEFDSDKLRAAEQRKLTYAQFSARGYIVAAAHISFPGIGKITAEGKAYRWLPVPYSIMGKIE